MSKDYYKILGVEKNTNQEDIKKAFRKKAHEYHPDKKSGDEAKFKEINEAYQVLGNEQKRKQYDQFGSAFGSGQAGFNQGFSGFGSQGFSGGINIDMDDLGDMFGGLGDMFGFSSSAGGRRSRRPARGEDVEAILSLDFKKAIFGGEEEINLKKKVVCQKCQGSGAAEGARKENCKTCGGSGRVRKIERTIFGSMQVEAVCGDCLGEGKKFSENCQFCAGKGIVLDNSGLKINIPAGINEGESIRLSGQGEAGERGSSAGDLYLRIKIRPDKKFKRDGYDIASQEEINFSQAALGGKIDIDTVHGPVSLKVPEGAQSGTIFKLKGKGVLHLNASGRGDHLVEIIVRTPKNLSRKEKEALRELNI